MSLALGGWGGECTTRPRGCAGMCGAGQATQQFVGWVPAGWDTRRCWEKSDVRRSELLSPPMQLALRAASCSATMRVWLRVGTETHKHPTQLHHQHTTAQIYSTIHCKVNIPDSSGRSKVGGNVKPLCRLATCTHTRMQWFQLAGCRWSQNLCFPLPWCQIMIC